MVKKTAKSLQNLMHTKIWKIRRGKIEPLHSRIFVDTNPIIYFLNGYEPFASRFLSLIAILTLDSV